jgi:hypothetical protein
MEHREVIQGGMIEKYVMHRLSGDLETAFEEHLLNCKKCREELATLKLSRQAIEDATYHKIFFPEDADQKSSLSLNAYRTGRVRRILAIAAGIAVLMGIGSLMIYHFTGKETQNRISGVNPVDSSDVVIAGTDNQDSVAESAKAFSLRHQNKDRLYANIMQEEAFRPNPLFEGMVKNTYRSGSISMLEPSDSINIYTESTVVFKWRASASIDLNLTILTNKGVKLAGLRGEKALIFNGFKKPGLYYWKLDNESETLAAGKIIVLRVN